GDREPPAGGEDGRHAAGQHRCRVERRRPELVRNARAFTPPTCPLRTATSSLVVTSTTRIEQSVLPANSNDPSGEKATAVMSSFGTGKPARNAPWSASYR